MLSSSHKQLLCFVWICLNMIIFHFDIAFSRRLDRQHCSPWDAEKKGTEAFFVFQALLHGLSHGLTALPMPQIGCDFKWWHASERRKVWPQLEQRFVRSSVVVVVSITELSCRTCPPAPPRLSRAGNCMLVLFCSVLETNQLFLLLLLLLEGADEMVWTMLVGSY